MLPTHPRRTPNSRWCCPLTHDELVAGGEDQIPYLVDTDRGVTMYESDESVEYLDEHYG